jgi:hypothetical protein
MNEFKKDTKLHNAKNKWIVSKLREQVDKLILGVYFLLEVFRIKNV